jgi:hypothetical protein
LTDSKISFQGKKFNFHPKEFKRQGADVYASDVNVEKLNELQEFGEKYFALIHSLICNRESK